MSKRTERRAAERTNRKLAFQQRQQSVAAAATAPIPSFANTEELARMEAESQTTAAQINANRANAQHSTGPVTAEGKATVSQNRRSHGLTGSFQILPTEDMLELKVLTETVYAEYQPETGTEQRLADSLIRHFWLMQRALRLQDDLVLNAADPSEIEAKRLALFMRYHTTHERSYYKAQKELQNLNKQKRKEQIGFESQQRQNEALEAKTRLQNARALALEVDANCRQVMEAPLPGTHNIPFEAMAKACGDAIAVLATSERQQADGYQNVGSQSAAR
jgi:hypothetical protein